MYHSHWGLRQSPYSDRPDPACFYHSPVHNEALARLHFLVDEHRRLGLLLGGAGAGKSLLCRVFAEQQARAGRPAALIDLVGIDSHELFWQIAAQWGLNPSPQARTFELWRLILDRLSEYRAQQLECVLLCDNADEARPEVREQVLRLVAGDSTPGSRFTAIVTASPATVLELGERLIDMAALKIDLEPWDEADTVEFLRSTLSRAGCSTAPFDAQAMIRLHQLSHGVPRRVSQLADLALLAGAGDKLPQIGAETVEAVYQELGVV